MGVPRKIRDLLKDYRKAGFTIVKGGKGDHRKLRHDKISGAFIVDGKTGDDCKPYQEKDLNKALSGIKSL